jgi:PPOX class probable F420-dependent enzyme
MPGYGVAGPTEGTGLLPWAWATDRLTRSHDYWLATVWPEGRPHVTPVWGVWQDGSFWFSCGRGSRKARNLERNPAVVATTDDPVSPVVVEGEAAVVEDRRALAAYAGWADAKYGTDYGVEFYGDAANPCFLVTVVSAFGLTGDDFTGSPTKWVLTPPGPAS